MRQENIKTAGIMKLAVLFLGICWWAFANVAEAGVHYSGESLASLPTQWRGFLLDQRQLRQIAIPGKAGQSPSPFRKKYAEERHRLEKAKKVGDLTPVELADLGALNIRLGNTNAALAILQSANRQFPSQYLILSNLASAWHLSGDLVQAEIHTVAARELAPGKWLDAESLYLTWLRELKKSGPGQTSKLFPARLFNDQAKLEPGKAGALALEKLPKNAVASAQLLGLWFPAEGKLLWQLAELANASGDAAVAASMLDGCVTEFGLRDAELLAQRRLLRDFLEGQGKINQAKHKKHLAGWFVPLSMRPLKSALMGELPPVDPKGVNTLPWEVLAQTQIGRQGLPDYPDYLKQLAGKQVTLTGFIQPVGEDFETSAFLLLEHPVGCWYCEMPMLTGMVYIELENGNTLRMTRVGIRITGKLQLRGDDPEKFLFSILGSDAETLP
ncbi:MAG: hypothetical protein EXR99_11900 [Gemmataceae bacterium]|nr:hypothetical protein [Gemmataceae bacterium]